jgi:uncharacterized protein with PIN domain
MITIFHQGTKITIKKYVNLKKKVMYGDKDNHTIFYFCVQHGWAGGHWSSLRKFYGRNHDLVDHYGISMLQMTTDMFHLS